MAARLDSAGSNTVANESFTATAPNRTAKPQAASSHRPRDFSNWAWRSRSGCETRTKARLGLSVTAPSRGRLPGGASGEGWGGLGVDASFMSRATHSTDRPLRGSYRYGARQGHRRRQRPSDPAKRGGDNRRRRRYRGRNMQGRRHPWWRWWRCWARRWRRPHCRIQAGRRFCLCLTRRWFRPSGGGCCRRGSDRAWHHQRFRP